MTQQTEIMISGGGIAGMIAAIGFASQGRDVICVDPAPPVTRETDAGSDLRSTAFLRPSVALFKKIGLWDRLGPYATPLDVMRIVDAGGAETKPRMTKSFNSGDLGDGLPFGWNLPNWLIKRELAAAIAEHEKIRFRPGTATSAVITRDDAAFIRLDDGTTINAKLLVAADGRFSPVREALGIGVRSLRYGQKALAFAVTHEIPHENVSTEIHRSGGPFTFVPLPDRDGKPSSAVIWMEAGPEVMRLRALSSEDFDAALNQRSAGVLGKVTLATDLNVWPIISQIADRFTGPRTALIAEAAHVVPPIGAQGLNMSLADIALLLDLATGDPGASKVLDSYERQRRPDCLTRFHGINMLNRASQASFRPLRDLRAAGLAALYEVAPLRRQIMRLGLGTAK